MRERRKVVIVGGGFGGLSAAKHLKSDLVDVTLIDRRNHHLFQPLLYQVATWSLSPGEIAYPLRGVLNRQKNLRVWLGTVQDIDPDSKRLFLADGEILAYDSLIVAAGSETTYYGHNQWRECAPGLKSIEEATAIRHKIRSKLPSVFRSRRCAALGSRSWSSVPGRQALKSRARLRRSRDRRLRTTSVPYTPTKRRSSCSTALPGY